MHWQKTVLMFRFVIPNLQDCFEIHLEAQREHPLLSPGPSPRHRGETSSTIMFRQRAMKVENMLKIKEEFDYKSLARKLDLQVESLIAEHERKQKAYRDEIKRISMEAKKQVTDTEKSYADCLECFCASNSRIFVSGSCDAIARLWDTRVASRAVRTFHGHEGDVNSVKFFPDGNRFGTGSDDGTCKLYDIRTGQQLQVYLQQQQQGGVDVLPVQGCANDRQVMGGKEFGIKESQMRKNNCSKCGGTKHNARTCSKERVTKKPNTSFEVVVNNP